MGGSTSTSSYDKTRRFQRSPQVTRTTPTTRRNFLTTSSSTSSTTSALTTAHHARGLAAAHSRKTIGNARGLDINSPRSAENHTQDLRFHRHQQTRRSQQRSGARQQLCLRS
jgi:hypothetical protein